MQVTKESRLLVQGAAKLRAEKLKGRKKQKAIAEMRLPDLRARCVWYCDIIRGVEMEARRWHSLPKKVPSIRMELKSAVANGEAKNRSSVFEDVTRQGRSWLTAAAWLKRIQAAPQGSCSPYPQAVRTT